MIDANAILGMLGDSGKMSATDISNLVSQKSPLPVPAAVVQGILDQLVGQGKLQKTEENGETYYHL